MLANGLVSFNSELMNHIIQSAIRELAIGYTAGAFTPLLLCKAVTTYFVEYLKRYFDHTLILFQDGSGIIAFRQDDNISDFEIDLKDYEKAIKNTLLRSDFPLITELEINNGGEKEYPLKEILSLCNNQTLNNCVNECKSILIARVTWNDGHTVGIMVFGRKNPKRFSEGEMTLAATITDILSNKLIGLCSRYFGPNSIAGESFGINNPFFTGKKTVAVLFADIRNYTTFMSKFEGRNEVKAGLLQYFERASQVIFQNNGMLDKFIGDGLMAIFGVLEKNENQSGLCVTEACRTAMELTKIFDKIKGDYFQGLIDNTSDAMELSVGAGIEYGDVYLDFFGHSRTWYYSAVGDIVNTAARLESKAGKKDDDQPKAYPTILVGKAAVNKFIQWQGFAGFEPTKVTLELKGKPIPIDAYGLRA